MNIPRSRRPPPFGAAGRRLLLCYHPGSPQQAVNHQGEMSISRANWSNQPSTPMRPPIVLHALPRMCILLLMWHSMAQNGLRRNLLWYNADGVFGGTGIDANTVYSAGGLTAWACRLQEERLIFQSTVILYMSQIQTSHIS